MNNLANTKLAVLSNLANTKLAVRQLRSPSDNGGSWWGSAGTTITAVADEPLLDTRGGGWAVVDDVSPDVPLPAAALEVTEERHEQVISWASLLVCKLPSIIHLILPAPTKNT